MCNFSATMLSKLSATIYPEYAQAYKLMTGKEKNPMYERIIQGTAREVRDSVLLNTPNGIIEVSVFINYIF